MPRGSGQGEAGLETESTSVDGSEPSMRPGDRLPEASEKRWTTQRKTRRTRQPNMEVKKAIGSQVGCLQRQEDDADEAGSRQPPRSPRSKSPVGKKRSPKENSSPQAQRNERDAIFKCLFNPTVILTMMVMQLLALRLVVM